MPTKVSTGLGESFTNSVSKRRKLAQSSMLSSSVQLLLAADSDFAVRRNLAANPVVFSEAQLLLAQPQPIYLDRHRAVDLALVHNENVCPAVLQLLSLKDDAALSWFLSRCNTCVPSLEYGANFLSLYFNSYVQEVLASESSDVASLVCALIKDSLLSLKDLLSTARELLKNSAVNASTLKAPCLATPLEASRVLSVPAPPLKDSALALKWCLKYGFAASIEDVASAFKSLSGKDKQHFILNSGDLLSKLPSDFFIKNI